MEHVDAGALSVACLRDGPRDGWPVILSHGFPYDVHAYDDVVPALTARGAHVIRPYLRGFGATRFRSADTVRSGQQAALGSDLIALVEALHLDGVILAGYDWGGLASCVAAALWPRRVAGLVSLAGYDIIDIERQRHTFDPAIEYAVWYQHLFQTERGRETLTEHRRDLCRMLWRQWSPRWDFDEDTFTRTAASFDNPDFVDVAVHAYRHALGQAPGDQALDDLERRLAARPEIVVPAVTLDGATDTLKPGGTADHARMFRARHEHRTIDAGHNLPQEAPAAFADAVLTVRDWLQ
ncbi:alpha/beta fold hydrolase [Actinoplanes xinjiangensis]|uniref:Pimeloyl-ACP methyl ester carboxylesterase n=1 Tax=Actinoplanes xinjiangensis TaxID=512350 RepID=A0A316F9Q8_9ACTN|nr:alpha/beta hydrolase [Actinoplanes xinjiangensis]PWK45058.1 pimeloyl-ACP methyl ester carboxylesterase [Actinoplanes xinjiangensis]GIF41605.1 alpha/beta hydrolase [Actinoplanes xinjiangensis]